MREGCFQEQAVMGAVRSGQWGSQLQAHAESCANCSEVVRVSRALHRLAAAPKPLLPPAGYVWWQSPLRERRAAQRRLSRIFAITRAATVSISMIAFAVWIIWHWSEVAEEIKGSLNSLSVWSSSSLASQSPALVYVGVSLLCLNVMLMIRAMVTNNKSQ